MTPGDSITNRSSGHGGSDNIAHMLWDTVAGAASSPAVIATDHRTDYGTLCARASALAAGLTRLGVRADDRVALFMHRGPEAAAAFFGIAAVGGIAVNVNETLRPRQIEYILGHAGVRVLLADADLLQRLPRPLSTAATVLPSDRLDATGRWRMAQRLGADVAQIVYTSGSTGLPKGVAVSHANLWAGTHAVVAYLGVSGEDRIASLLPFSFDYGLNQLLCAVSTGAALVVERSPIPHRVVNTLRRHAVTVLPCVPPLWHQLLTVDRFRNTPVPTLRAMTNTGGRLASDAVRVLRRAQSHARLFLMFGLTEAFRSTYLPPDEVDEHPESIGSAIPGAQIMVLRDDGTSCDPDEVGEFVHRGPTVALGYWNDPEATASVFRPNPMRQPGVPDTERVVFSGDLVRRDAEGRLYHVGRRDGMIKTLGYRVSPDEVAAVIYGSGQVVEAVVSAETDVQRGARIVAHVVLAPEGALERVAAFCGAELPRYMQPARFDVHRSLPRTASGKYDVRALAPS